MIVKQFIAQHALHNRYKLSDSWSNFGINIFKRLLGGTKEYKIRVGSDTYTVYVNKSEDVHVPIHNAFERMDGNKITYAFMTKDGSQDCGALVINQEKRIGFISMLYNTPGCVMSDTAGDITNSVGTKMLQVMIEWCRLRHMTHVYLEDESKFYCKTSDIVPSINLLKAYTMTNGHPWYFNFGFKMDDRSFDRIVEYNKNLHARIKTQDVNKTDFMKAVKKVVNRYKINSDIQAISSLYDEYTDKLFGEFLKVLQRRYCTIFAWIYSDLYDAIGYKNYKGFYMIKDLQGL